MQLFKDQKEKCFDVLVIKPASQNVVKMIALAKRHELRFVITSFMSHALDQVITLFEAMNWQGHPLYFGSGLITHEVYEQDDFFKKIKLNDSKIYLEEAGYGWGFTQELDALKWTEIRGTHAH